ncbi:hypothetical protein [Streptomyces sp. NBC_00102]|uniref:hypothetical protein n=1 Tax=Streptomyces sp. NBC_00102 TaxID=2975652 RepID=UPI0022590993|nr:hypothetical protein [Streptomyces sp. NBC_00102]MCX5399867.1 hypothetical protein [Streptomyces sp. NBC_00102]
MNSDWLSVRLTGEPGAPPDPHAVSAVAALVPGLVHGQLASAATAVPVAGVRAPVSAELWLRAGPEVIDALEMRLRTESAGLGVRLHLARPGRPEDGTVRRLSALGEELAAAVPGAADLSPSAQAATAARHLRLLTGLLPQAQRGAFLFQCWQYWSMPFTPAVRTRLSAAADGLDVSGSGAGGPEDTAWAGYDRAVRAFAEESAERGLPVLPFHWFGHARHVHRILGVPPEAESCAALALRRALSGREPAVA